MTDTITIPPEALQAALIAHHNSGGDMSATIRAALNAWPGMIDAKNGSSLSLCPQIILPLPPQENTDAEA